MMIDVRKAKDTFIDRQNDLDDRIIFFDEHYDKWVASLPPEVVQVALSMLEHFEYYSHQDANKMLRSLHEQFLKQAGCKESDALYTYIKKAEGRICSSIEYWAEYRIINRIDSNSCTDDICRFRENEWKLVDNIVIIDDCCGSGSSLEKFIKFSGKDFSGKTIYYLVLHALDAAKPKLNHIEADYNVTINILAIHTRGKACEIISGDNKVETQKLVERASQKLKINPIDSLGRYDSEGLMAFYNNTPNNTIGLFWFESEKNSPIFPRKVGAEPKWRLRPQQMNQAKRARKENNYMAVKKSG